MWKKNHIEYAYIMKYIYSDIYHIPLYIYIFWGMGRGPETPGPRRRKSYPGAKLDPGDSSP